ncbi:MAG: hypothetical protein ACKOIB_11365, partial [Verrucomicrobiota bacterium]
GTLEAGSEPPVRLAPVARVMALEMVMLLRSSVPPAPTETVLVPRASALPTFSVPPEMVVAPE